MSAAVRGPRPPFRVNPRRYGGRKTKSIGNGVTAAQKGRFTNRPLFRLSLGAGEAAGPSRLMRWKVHARQKSHLIRRGKPRHLPLKGKALQRTRPPSPRQSAGDIVGPDIIRPQENLSAKPIPRQFPVFLCAFQPLPNKRGPESMRQPFLKEAMKYPFPCRVRVSTSPAAE
jgi:hypothetical protein